MRDELDCTVRRAAVADASTAAALLYDFNTEFEAPTPEPEALEARITELLSAEGRRRVGDRTFDETVVLLGGTPAAGIVVLRFRLALWSAPLECYLAELYVTPDLRGRGLGSALLTAALAEATNQGADRIELATTTDDEGAIRLYERFGFSNREDPPDGAIMLMFERGLE